jgi:hypothetical protein
VPDDHPTLPGFALGALLLGEVASYGHVHSVL